MGEGGSIGRATVIWYIVISKDCRKREKRKEKRKEKNGKENWRARKEKIGKRGKEGIFELKNETV